MLATEIIGTKRDRGCLSEPQVQAFVRGLVDGSWSEGQVAALAMAILLNGMDRAECVALTRAMTDSGQRLRWPGAAGARPGVDQPSTGGVGDKVSLVLAPIVAACGGLVPMLSGRGLGHTGGTLDKLQALPGYQVAPSRAQLLRVLQGAGCAIVGASDDLAPADRRLYAVRDVTATVESVPLITASILSKKLAAGLGHLVMDVKVGNGAFMANLADAQTLARSLVEVAAGAGLPCTALITDMNQVLGYSAGNALEVAESLAFLTGAERAPRLLKLTLALAAQMLRGAGLAPSVADAEVAATAALTSGRAAECFARMVAGLGGPPDVLADPQLAAAPVVVDLPAPRDGVLVAMDTRAIGLAVVALGGGRRRAADPVDPRVGFDRVRPLGSVLRAGEPLMRVHAATTADAAAACAAVQAAVTLQAAGSAGVDSVGAWVEAPLILDTLGVTA